MSISSEINRIAQNVSDSLSAVAAKGATVPSGSTSDDLPDLIASLPSTQSVTYNLTNGASASINPSKVISGQGFSTRLKAPTGYALAGVQVTMGGVDITSQVLTYASNVEPVLDAKTITANGTYTASDDDLDGYSEVTVNVPEPVSNIVMGTFTTGSTTGAVGSISVPYEGDGFPIAAMVFVKGGSYNNTSTGDTEWYNSTQRYAVGQWTYHNAQQSETCYTGVTTAIYKNSTSTATTYTRTSAMNTTVRTSSNPTGAALTSVRMSVDGKTLKWYIASTSYGLLASTEYQYIMIFSE